jgi:hypothetical protein
MLMRDRLEREENERLEREKKERLLRLKKEMQAEKERTGSIGGVVYKGQSDQALCSKSFGGWVNDGELRRI